MSKLVPITELSDELSPDCNIGWRLDPGPYVDSERIGFDLSAAKRISRVAGWGGAILTSYLGEQSQIQVNATGITGINADGSATGTGSASVIKAEKQRNTLSGDSHPMHNCRWPLVTVEVNRNELASNISDDVRRGASREAAWARQTSRAIGSGMIQAAKHNLLTEPLKDLSHALNFSLFVATAIQKVIAHGPLEMTNAWVVHQLGTVGFGLFANKLSTGKLHPGLMRHSLFPWGVQADRFALAALLIKTRPLVRLIN